MPVDSGVVTTVLSSAGAGTALIVVLLLTGLLALGSEVKRAQKEADEWKTAYEAERKARETERAAGEESRRALLLQTQRADAAVQTAEITRDLLEDFRRRRDAAAR